MKNIMKNEKCSKNAYIRILCIYAEKSVRCPPLKDIPLEYKVKLDLTIASVRILQVSNFGVYLVKQIFGPRFFAFNCFISFL